MSDEQEDREVVDGAQRVCPGPDDVVGAAGWSVGGGTHRGLRLPQRAGRRGDEVAGLRCCSGQRWGGALEGAFGAPESVELWSDHGRGTLAATLQRWRSGGGVVQAFAPVGRPTGNAVAERTIQTMQVECLWRSELDDVAGLQAALDAWRTSCNEERPPSRAAVAQQVLGPEGPSTEHGEDSDLAGAARGGIRSVLRGGGQDTPRRSLGTTHNQPSSCA